MVQAVYIRRLRRCLHWYYGLAETEEILGDYRDFFAAGIAEGESEEALCRRFGCPGTVVRALAGGRKTRLYAVRLGAAVLSMAALAALYLVGILRGLTTHFAVSVETDTVVYTVVTIVYPVLLWLLLAENPAWQRELHLGFRRRLRGVLLASCVVAALSETLLGGCYFTTFTALPAEEMRLFGFIGTDPVAISLLAVTTLLVGGSVLFAGVSACLYALARGRRQAAPCMCLLLGALSTLAKASNSLRMLIDQEEFAWYMLFDLIPTLAGILMALLFWGVSRLCDKRESIERGVAAS